VFELACFFLFGVELIDTIVEEPFGKERDDLDLDRYCRTIRDGVATSICTLSHPVHEPGHPTDYSACSRAAFDVAAGLTRTFGAELIVLHVMPPVEVIPSPQGSLAYQWDFKQARALLNRIDDPSLRVRHLLVEGNPTDEILKTIGSEKVDLIVMGTHGWSGMNRFLLGSVAEHVLRKASCPVLTVRAADKPSPAAKPMLVTCATA
jgi:nucleotide-binding universal stress UspA family protein